MKKLAMLMMVLPGMAAAHGVHAPGLETTSATMQGFAHGAAHVAPILGLAIILAALGLRQWQRGARE